MRSEISEFSYGFALTEELIHTHSLHLNAAPVFPSLYQEGQKGGGYDVKLSGSYCLLFLQFKMSHYMYWRGTKEVKMEAFEVPFYRMHITSHRNYKQHQMLLDLEEEGNDVFYVTPKFFTHAEFHSIYLKQQVAEHSVWISPLAIGNLCDQKNHHVAFDSNTTKKAFLFSEPKILETNGSFENFIETMHRSIRKKDKHPITEENLKEMVIKIEVIVENNLPIRPRLESIFQENISDYHPLKQLALYSQIFFESQLFVVRE